MHKPAERGAEWNGSFFQLLRMRNFRLLWGAGALLALLCLAVIFRREIRSMKMPANSSSLGDQ